jgi:WD40 repeat protein
VRIWDLESGRLRAELTGHAGAVTAVAIAPDGAWLASAGEDGSVRIWDPVSGGIGALMRVDRPLRACAWGPFSQSLAVAGVAGLYHFTFKP